MNNINIQRLLLYISCTVFFIFIGINNAFAQPSNDNCENATQLLNVTTWCSESGAYTNAQATPSGYDGASCFSQASNDVWFKFVAFATDVSIVINGASGSGAGGTLQKPAAALYVGTCGGTIIELECGQDNAGNNIVEIYKGGLVIGATYLIRVQGVSNNVGTFSLCINNYNPPSDPQSDCPQAAVLCDKSPFSVQQITSAGADPDEAAGTCLDDPTTFTTSESNSTWFSWIAKNNGSLTFTLTPLNPSDDLDFVVYELPNGLNNCSGKIPLRCMAAGSFDFPSICMGPTGLSLTATDFEEPIGCLGNFDHDNYIKYIDMQAGKAYALMVNNFSETGNGFSIEWGGTGQFAGPEVSLDLSVDKDTFCVDELITVTDIVNFPSGSITGWNWILGENAVPATVANQGPHTLSYTSDGQKFIALTVETNLGCKVTEILPIYIYPLTDIDTIYNTPMCGGGMDGAITIVPEGTASPFTFDWMDGNGFTTNPTKSNLSIGLYDVSVKNKFGCISNFAIPLNELQIAPDPFVEAITEPTCYGYSDGTITVSVLNGAPPFLYDFGSGYQSSNVHAGFSSGTYNVTVEDVNQCHGIITYDVNQPSEIVLMLDTIDISCYGVMDGSAGVISEGGTGTHNYIWSNGNSSNVITNLSEGNYVVSVTDANNCLKVGSFYIKEPIDLVQDVLNVVGVVCYGDKTGEVSIEASGGTPGYQFSGDGGVTFSSDSIVRQLPGGDVLIIAQDSEGCKDTISVFINQPPPLIVNAWRDTTVNLGYPINLYSDISPSLAEVSYTWTPLEMNIEDPTSPNTSALPLNTTYFIVTIEDSTHCIAKDSVLVRVKKERPLFIPSAFSPNEDGNNDFFTAYGGPAITEIQLVQIFDRWGDLLYEGSHFPVNNSSLGWNGKLNGKHLPQGVYTYLFKILFIDNVVIIYSGDVTLLR